MFNYCGEDIKDYHVGQIVVIKGKKYRLRKKTSTAIAMERYYWWDAVVDWLVKKVVNV